MSGGSSESETSEETVTPIRSPSTSTLRIETPCGHSRIRARSSSPVVTAANATEQAQPCRSPLVRIASFKPGRAEGFSALGAGHAVQMSDGEAGQQQASPGLTGLMEPTPDHGEGSYVGHGRLAGKKAIVTGGDSGI